MMKNLILTSVVGVALIATEAAFAQPDFPMWCRGKNGTASTNGQNVIVDFVPANGAAPNGLGFGECSWLDRPLRSGEPTRIVAEVFSVTTAQEIAASINRGQLHTFWVFNAGRFFHANAESAGAQRQKPGSL